MSTAYNICLGKNSGYDITIEHNLFCVNVGGKEYRTKMSRLEYWVLSRIVSKLKLYYTKEGSNGK